MSEAPGFDGQIREIRRHENQNDIFPVYTRKMNEEEIRKYGKPTYEKVKRKTRNIGSTAKSKRGWADRRGYQNNRMGLVL